jgi:predicted RNase H-like HicB family nuclease
MRQLLLQTLPSEIPQVFFILISEANMTYKVVLVHTEEGYSVYVPSLPGCASQGQTQEEAMENIQDALHDYLEVIKEMKQKPDNYEVDIREVQVA